LQVPHTGGHLGFLLPTDIRAPQIQAMKKMLGQMNEVMQGLAKQAAAGTLQGQQQEQQQEQPQEDPNAEQKMKLQNMQDEHNTRMGILKSEADQRMALKDAESAQESARNLRRPQPLLATSNGVAPTPRTTPQMTAVNQ
jgi:hypothetical protein